MLNRSVLLIGSNYANESREVEQVVRQVVGDCELRACTSVAAAINSIRRDDWFPDLVVISQTWSDEFTRDEVEHLISECALARMVVAYGPWCDSDGRNRSIWPLAVRVSLCLLASRLKREVDVLSGRCEPLPLTANRDEIFAFDRGRDQLNARREDSQSGPTRVTLSVRDPGLRASLAAQLADEGIQVSGSDGTGLRIYDSDVDETADGLGLSAMPECESSGRPVVSKLASVDEIADAILRRQV